MVRTVSRKRPCRICRRWFVPDVRQSTRQKTCGRPECQRQWHSKLCSRWNQKNKAYFKANYLDKKIERAERLTEPAAKTPSKAPMAGSRIQLHLPTDCLRQALGTRGLVIAEYMAEQIISRRQCRPGSSGCARDRAP